MDRLLKAVMHLVLIATGLSQVGAIESLPLTTIERVHGSMVLMVCPKGESGSGFVVEHEKNFFVVTASHVCTGVKTGDAVRCILKSQKADLPLACSLLVFDNIRDVAIYSVPQGNYVIQALNLTLEPVPLATEIGFAGYPFAIKETFFIMTRKGMVGSTMSVIFNLTDAKTKEQKAVPVDFYLINGISNPGDSGGPVFLSPSGDVIAIIKGTTGILKDYSLIMKYREREVDLADKPTGILVAVPVKYVVDLLKSATTGK